MAGPRSKRRENLRIPESFLQRADVNRPFPSRTCHRPRAASASRCSTPAFPASASGSATPRMPTRRGAARPDGSPSSCTPVRAGSSTDPAHHRRLWPRCDDAGGSAAHRRGMALADREGHRPCRDRGRTPCGGSPRAGAADQAFVHHRRGSIHRRQAGEGAQRQGGRARPAQRLHRGMGRAARSARSPRSTCWRSSTPRSAPRRRWPARCWSSSSGSSLGDRPASLRPDHVAMRPAVR